MLFENNSDIDDLGLAARYYRLRKQHIYYSHVLENYRRYGALAPVLAQFSSLCAGFVHDLGNGLNVIRSRLERIAYALDTPKAPEHPLNRAIAFCEVCGWRLYALTEVSPSRSVHAEPVDLPVWIPRLLRSLSVLCPPSVEMEFQASVSRMIVAEYDNKLRVALMELLLNAFEAMDDGTPGCISIALHRCGEDAVQIELIDRGPGLPRPDVEALFDLHVTTHAHQLLPERCSVPQRYGMGLYLARKIVQKHRGSLTLESAPDGGTRAVVRLPLGVPEPPWDDEHALMLALERKWDQVAAQRQDIRAYMEAYDLDRAPLLAGLSDLFGRLSTTVVAFLRAGLEGIRTSLTQLAARGNSEAVLQNIRFIDEKCDYCKLLLGNARALNPDAALCWTSLDLNAVVSAVTARMAWRVQPETDLRVRLAPELPSIQADETLVATAYMDLLRNALDAAGPDGFVEVETFFDTEEVGVRLTNTRDCIPFEQELEHMFDLNYTTRQGRAFGLGVYTARAIMEAHQGAITIAEVGDAQLRMMLAWKRARPVPPDTDGARGQEGDGHEYV